MAQILIIQNQTKSLQIEVGIKWHYVNLKFDVLKATTVKKKIMLMIEAATSFETSVYIYQTPRHHIQEDSGLNLYYISKSWVLQSLISVIFLRDLNELS